ncbi:hypothetical protein [Arthrobacter sp. Marseille-P9274]|uniref:hypothetical protein n=1 Tax=Arthrobacter sp. Marseille-P9274 TaxID=2866572 RepID=UPI0021C74A89|nr:hypothetical protein [Arthrobacter sp. Marseille-P9274]
MSQVRAIEGNDPVKETDDVLAFAVKLGRFDCAAIYIFVSGQLARGKYRLVEEYQNQNKYLSAFDELKDSVTKKYGAPNEDRTYWLNDLYRDDFSEWGMAVSCGHLSKFASWDTEESFITVGILGENFDVTVGVEYSGKAFAALEDKLKEDALLEDL